MTCSCVSCKECKGTGNVWVSFTREYLGSSIWTIYNFAKVVVVVALKKCVMSVKK